MKLLFYIMAITFLFSCNNNDSSSKILSQLNPTDTFLYDVPKVNPELDSLRIKEKLFIEKGFGLQSLEKGFDSIEIRIQYGCHNVGDRLVILLNKGNKWAAEVSKLGSRPNPDYKGEPMTNYWEEYIPTRTIENKTPRSGWESFINKLFKLKVLFIEDDSKINGYDYGVVNDGDYISVEIATKNVYRYYGMGQPDYFYEELWQAKNLSKILKLIDDELQLKPIWPYIPDKDAYKIDTAKSVPKIEEVKIEDIKPDSVKQKK